MPKTESFVSSWANTVKIVPPWSETSQNTAEAAKSTISASAGCHGR